MSPRLWLTESLDKVEPVASNWDGTTCRLRAAQAPIEADSLFLGTHLTGRYPILLPRSALHHHAHILGSSGSGKTSLAVLPLIIQLIRQAGRDRVDPRAKQQSSVFILDLKGDPVLLQTAAIEAANAGLPFKGLTNILGLSTFGFNPLYQAYLRSRSAQQLAETILIAVGLDHGPGYGRSWFSGAARDGLQMFLQHFGHAAFSFRQLYPYCVAQRGDAIAQAAKKEGFKLTEQDKQRFEALYQTMRALADVDLLNVAPNDGFPPDVVEQQIDVLDVRTRPQVVYFFLDPSHGKSAVRQIAGLALYSLYAASTQREANRWIERQTDTCPHQTYVFIDEFQRIVEENTADVFEQARSAGLAIIAAHQNLSQLRVGEIDLSSTITQSTGVRWIFAARDSETIETVTRSSGSPISLCHDPAVDIRDFIGPDREFDLYSPDRKLPYFETRINHNDLLQTSANPQRSILQIADNTGLCQFDGFPFILESQHPYTLEETRRRKSMFWPDARSGTFTPDTGLFREKQKAEPQPASESPAQASEAPPPESPPKQSSGRVDDVLKTLKQRRDEQQYGSHTKSSQEGGHDE